MRRHIAKHTGQRLVKCEFCEKTFSRRDNLKRHILTIHEDHSGQSETSTIVISGQSEPNAIVASDQSEPNTIVASDQSKPSTIVTSDQSESSTIVTVE